MAERVEGPPLVGCPHCHGMGECDNAQFRCHCRWHRYLCPAVLKTGHCDCPDTAKRTKAIHIGAPACFSLEEAIRPVCEAFGVHCCYVVGSALERPDWRDVDVRLILDDDAFQREFSLLDHYEWSPRWLLFITAISERLSRQTGLPIDFQIQPRTHANGRHNGPRNAIGLRFPVSNTPDADRRPRP